jgi:hypothetical protein
MHDMKETKSVVVYFYGSLRLSSVSPANPDENRQEPASTLSLFTGPHGLDWAGSRVLWTHMVCRIPSTHMGGNGWSVTPFFTSPRLYNKVANYI